MIKTNIFSEIFESESRAAIVTSLSGDYFLSSDNYTKYQGFCVNEEMEIYKIIDKILLKDSKVIERIFNPNYIEVISEKGKQKFSLNSNGLLYENYSDENSEFILDARKLFDMSNFGRYYEITNENGVIIIKYNKRKDISESSIDEYEIYIAIKKEDSSIEEIKVWNDCTYEFDSLRNDIANRYIYHAFSSSGKRFAISASRVKEVAVKKAIKLYDEGCQETKFTVKTLSASKEINYAYNLSINALSNLSKKNLKGIYAGMPWFMQFWTRDAALSSKSALHFDKDFVRDLLYGYIKKIREDGLISNRYPYSNLDSIDSTGIVFFRIKENIQLFNKEELRRIYEMLKKSIDSIMINHFDRFVINKNCETWMDTQAREGARIEIQCLFLSMLSLARELSATFSDPISSKFYLSKEKFMLEEIRKAFFSEKMLLDGTHDFTIRPNVFLAYYFYPKLLTDKEWEKVFSKHLEALFLDWGGIATIDRNDSRFSDKHTGMNNYSYHNGDSWYFVNNMAAICLYKLNKEKFKKYISKIVDSSTEEILNKGIMGYHSEISSASKFESNGCLAQAWSSALYIEMIDEIYLN